MPRRSTPFLDLLLQDLTDPREAAAYVNAALEDSTEMFLTAIKDVAQARQMATVAKTAGVRREHLYRTFSEHGNPTIATLRSVLHALGLEFDGVRPLNAAAVAPSPAAPAIARKRTRLSHRTA